MTNIEKNAVKIWGLLNPAPDTHCAELHAENKKHLSKRYTEYNGLMPIVWEIQRSENFQMYLNPDKIEIDCTSSGIVKSVSTLRYNTEAEFIEALQKCVIRYLELKGKSK